MKHVNNKFTVVYFTRWINGIFLVEKELYSNLYSNKNIKMFCSEKTYDKL